MLGLIKTGRLCNNLVCIVKIELAILDTVRNKMRIKNALKWDVGLLFGTIVCFALYTRMKRTSLLEEGHMEVFWVRPMLDYRKSSNISRTLIGNIIVGSSDVVGASPVGLLQLHLHSQLNIWLQWISRNHCTRIQETFKLWDLVRLILEVLR